MSGRDHAAAAPGGCSRQLGESAHASTAGDRARAGPRRHPVTSFAGTWRSAAVGLLQHLPSNCRCDVGAFQQRRVPVSGQPPHVRGQRHAGRGPLRRNSQPTAGMPASRPRRPRPSRSPYIRSSARHVDHDTRSHRPAGRRNPAQCRRSSPSSAYSSQPERLGREGHHPGVEVQHHRDVPRPAQDSKPDVGIHRRRVVKPGKFFGRRNEGTTGQGQTRSNRVTPHFTPSEPRRTMDPADHRSHLDRQGRPHR